MKRTAFFIAAVLLCCTACADSRTNESKPDSITQDDSSSADGIVQVDWQTQRVYQWQDYYRKDYPFGEDFELHLALADFPDTEFIWRDMSIYAAENGEECALLGGMPLWNAFFTDLNGDGYPELCSTVSFGSGIIDDHIIVYDHHNQTHHTLNARFSFDYSLYLEDDVLYVRKVPYPAGADTEEEIGILALEQGGLITK